MSSRFNIRENISLPAGVFSHTGRTNIKRTYQKAVQNELDRSAKIKPGILSEADIHHLPAVVQKYLRYTGSVGKTKVVNFRAEFRGGIRFSPSDDFMPLRSVQYNFTDQPSRLFYIVAKKYGIPVVGVHLYLNQHAIFKIKILGLFTVVDAKGKEMDQGETVTLLNDMCVMAPASLIDHRIRWESIDELSVKAVFTNGHITISALLYFNEKGELSNFISNDRFETDGKVYKNYPWSTPITGYRDVHGYRLPSGAKLLYSRADGEFCYGEFELHNIEYNCRVVK